MIWTMCENVLFLFICLFVYLYIYLIKTPVNIVQGSCSSSREQHLVTLTIPHPNQIRPPTPMDSSADQSQA